MIRAGLVVTNRKFVENRQLERDSVKVKKGPSKSIGMENQRGKTEGEWADAFLNLKERRLP